MFSLDVFKQIFERAKVINSNPTDSDELLDSGVVSESNSVDINKEDIKGLVK